MAETPDPEQRWGRQKGETVKAFQAFVIYRDQGPARSGYKVADELGKSTTLIGRWSARWDWVERAALYDAHLDRVRRLENEDKLRLAKNKQVKIAEMALDKIRLRLETLGPDEISVQNLYGLLKTAADIELRALGDNPDMPLAPDGEIPVFQVNWVRTAKAEADGAVASSEG